MIHPVHHYFLYHQILNQSIETYENEYNSDTKMYKQINEDDT